MTLQEYEILIDRCAVNHINQAIANSSSSHAQVGIKALLRHATKSVQIISTEFFYDFWVNLLDDLCAFLKKDDSHLSVVIEDRGEGLAILKGLAATFPGKVSVHQLCPEKVQNRLGLSTKQVPNFFVSEAGYRFETSDEQRNLKKVFATINFGDDVGRGNLLKTFGTVREKLSNPLELVA